MARLNIPFMSVTCNIKETDVQIDQKMLNALRIEVTKRLHWTSLANPIKLIVQDVVGQQLRLQPEYVELISSGGILRTQLGLATNSIDAIIALWLNGINVKITPIRRSGSQLMGRIIITGLPKDLSDVMALGQYSTEKGTTIPWLDWLMNLGDQIIITTHNIGFYPPASRTDGTVMVKSERGWAVPSQYSGTIDNNYVTRAIDSSLPLLSQELGQFIKSRM